MKTITTAAAGAVALLGMLTLPGCQRPMTQVTWEMNGMPAHDHPYQMWWQYQFVYHPQEQVYFEPFTGTYFWYSGDQWEEGSSLPQWITINSDRAEIVKLQQPKPYTQHHAVMKWSWPYSTPLPGALDQFHSTPEAIAASELRASMRIGADEREVMNNNEPWDPMSGDIDLMVPVSDASEDSADPFMGVDASGEMDAMPGAQQETADALAEMNAILGADGAETATDESSDEDEFFTVVDPMADGNPDD